MTHSVDSERLAPRFISLEVHESTHDRLVWGMRQNRDKAVAGVPEWEELRELASEIKEHTLTHLDQSLEEFEANAIKLGTHVHWARDAEEHPRSRGNGYAEYAGEVRPPGRTIDRGDDHEHHPVGHRLGDARRRPGAVGRSRQCTTASERDRPVQAIGFLGGLCG